MPQEQRDSQTLYLKWTQRPCPILDLLLSHLPYRLPNRSLPRHYPQVPLPQNYSVKVHAPNPRGGATPIPTERVLLKPQPLNRPVKSIQKSGTPPAMGLVLRDRDSVTSVLQRNLPPCFNISRRRFSSSETTDSDGLEVCNPYAFSTFTSCHLSYAHDGQPGSPHPAASQSACIKSIGAEFPSPSPFALFPRRLMRLGTRLSCI